MLKPVFPGTPARPDEERLVLLGLISKPHGLKGGLRMRPEFDDPDDFENLKTDRLFIKVGQSSSSLRPQAASYYEVTLEEFQEHQRNFILYFEGITDMTTAEMLRSTEVYVYEDELWDLTDGRFYTFQLVGLELYDSATDAVVGTVKSVRAGVQDYLVVRAGNKEFLVPYVPEIVSAVDLETKRITAKLPEGIMDI